MSVRPKKSQAVARKQCSAQNHKKGNDSMKKYRKQILAMLLAAVLALSLLPVSALAENPQDADPYIYMHDADIQY